MVTNLNEQLMRDELLGDLDQELWPYFDCCGKRYRDCTCATKGNLTIGVGHNLDAKPLSHSAASVLFDDDVRAARNEVLERYPWSGTMPEVYFGVLVNMSFCMGAAGLRTFYRFLASMTRRDYARAAAELRDSEFWQGPHRTRAERLARQLETGQWQ